MSDLIPPGEHTDAELTRLKEKYAAEARFTLTRSDDNLTAEESARLDDLEGAIREIDQRLDRNAQLRRAESAFHAGAIESPEPATGPQVIRHRDPWAGGDLDRAHGPELRSRTLTAMERMSGDDAAREAAYKVVERQSTATRNGELVTQWALVASAPAYASAFEKVLRDPVRGHLSWTAAEAAAYREVAAMEQRLGSTSSTAGGYAIPTHLDPTFVINSVGVSHPFRQISRVVQLAEGGTWNGVTTAGLNLSFDEEGAEVSDDSPTLGRTDIPVFRQQGFVGGSFELIDDVPSLGAEVSRLFVDAVDVGESNVFVKGNGTTEPTGIVTALYAQTSRWSTHTTNSAMTATDVLNAQQSLGSRWSKRASWVSSLTYQNRVRAFGTNYWGQSSEFNQAVSPAILGRASYEASDMSTALNTVTNVAWVYGDFTNYVIVDRIGSRVSYIPHLFGASGRPTGQAGWHLYRRVGAEPMTTTSFVLSVNPGA